MRTLASIPVLATLILGLTASIIWLAYAPYADQFSMLNTQWNGCSKLSSLGFQSVNSGFEGRLNYAATPAVLMIISPRENFTDSETASIESFLQRGGFVILADNFGSGNSLLSKLDVPIRFSGQPLVDTLFFEKQPSFLKIVDVTHTELTRGINTLVLGSATPLDMSHPSKISVLARSSPYSFLGSEQNSTTSLQGPFPVLADIRVGDGFLIVLGSPASFANDLINVEDNNVLITDIIEAAARSGHQPVLLFDEQHLTGQAGLTKSKLAAKSFISSLVDGTMTLEQKMALTVFAMGILSVRFLYQRPVSSGMKPRNANLKDDVDTVMKLHPNWDRKRLEHVARALEFSKTWRRLDENE